MAKKQLHNFVGGLPAQVDLTLLLLCCAASGYGLVLIASATATQDSFRHVLVQGAGIVLGIVLYCILSVVDITGLCKRWKTLFLFNVGIIALLLTPLGIERNGNRAWLGTEWFPVNIQPAEIAKISFILLLAHQLNGLQEKHNLRQFVYVARPAVHTLFMMLLIFVVSSDAGSALVYLSIFLCMAYVAGAARRWFVLVIGGASAGLIALWHLDLIPAYMRDRILVVLDHSYQPLNKGWQQTRSMLALGSGKLSGMGLFNGTQTQSELSSSLPERQTDFIFSVCGEELGFIGCLVVIVLLFAIVVRCLVTARDAANPIESYICTGFAAVIIFQSVANIGMCLFFLPVIGLTLPFFSYGGSSIVTMFAAMGIVSGVRKRSKPEWMLN